ncbi:MAG: helix-turn-helix transcriptional regulator [Candidatus Aureabacteria bacterium]|nr:helix-turn-helix transcriptional regulator [Candidatus Auribacterota bacterium]
MSIGQNIKKYRKRRKLTQVQLAEKIGVVQSNVHRWEANLITPSIDTVKKLSKILKVSTDNLILNDD